MNSHDWRRLFAAPELVVVELLDSSLVALRLALLAEHPLVDRPSDDFHEPPVQRRARAILKYAFLLRRALRAYRREVNHVLVDIADNDIPF